MKDRKMCVIRESKKTKVPIERVISVIRNGDHTGVLVEAGRPAKMGMKRRRLNKFVSRNRRNSDAMQTQIKS